MTATAEAETSVVALTGGDFSDPEFRARYHPVDGPVGLDDIARAAGISRGATKRAIAAYVKSFHACSGGFETPLGAILNIDEVDVPPEGVGTRAQLGLILAQRMKIGRFGLKTKIAERASTRTPPPNRREKKLGTLQHPWRDGQHGRSCRSVAGGGLDATLACSRCETTETIHFRQLAGVEAMDRKFAQNGWAVDPAKCPEHNPRNHTPKERHVATLPASKPSPAAIAAQAKMYGLLQTQFDADQGHYRDGYSDAKVATECGVAADLVTAVRNATFGELKEPPEIAQISRDIDALEALVEEAITPIRTELASLRARVNEVRRKFSA